MLTGLQVGFGELIDPIWLLRVKDQEFQVCRISGQQGHQEQSAEDCHDMTIQILELGMIPLITIQDVSQTSILPEHTIIEHFNEGDIKSNLWSTQDMRRMNEIIDATNNKFELYVGASVSGLHKRGYEFLKQFDWKRIPSHIGCSIHRYPHGNSWLNPTPSGSLFCTSPKNRAQEVQWLRNIIGSRPLAITEVGYCNANWTEQQQSDAMRFEHSFWKSSGAQIIIAYQMIDGITKDCENTYGAFYHSGQPKPWVQSFIQGA